MAKNTDQAQKAQVSVKDTEEYRALEAELQKAWAELDRVKKELAAERARPNIIEEAKQVASATGDLRYRGHFIPAIHNRNITPAFGMVLAVRMMEVLDTLREMPAEIGLIVREVIKDQVVHKVRVALAEQVAQAENLPEAEGTD